MNRCCVFVVVVVGFVIREVVMVMLSEIITQSNTMDTVHKHCPHTVKRSIVTSRLLQFLWGQIWFLR